MSKCVICDTAANLNTKMTITLEDKSQVQVFLCDDHAEDTTAKVARESYLSKQDKIKELLEHAKSLGVEISIKDSGLIIATESTEDTKKVRDEAKPIRVSATQTTQNEQRGNVKTVSTKELNSNRFEAQRISGAGVPSVGFAGLSTSSLKDKLPDDALEGTAEITVMEGRTNQPLLIPMVS